MKNGLLTYEDVAEKIGIPRGTLSRKLIKHNKTAKADQRIEPDKIEDHGHYRIHLFTQATAARIGSVMKSMNTPRGRRKNPAPSGENK